MRTFLLLGVPFVLSGCGSACACLSPDGPPLDFDALLADVEAVYEPEISGTVADEPGDGDNGVVFEPCAMDGETFTLSLDVGAPTSCDDRDDSTASSGCESAKEAHYPVTGSVTIGAGEAQAFDGAIVVWSGEAGPHVFQQEFEAPVGDVPHQAFDPATNATSLLDELVFEGAVWSRRHSAEDAEETVWEVCALKG